MIYRPPLIKQLDGSTYAGQNCTVAATCMAVVRHFLGKNPPGTAHWYPLPSVMRRAMRDTIGGTNLAQNEAWALRYYNADLVVHYRYPWADFRNAMKTRGAVLQGSYRAFHGTRYDASGTFMGNHAVYINEVRYNTIKKRYEYLMFDPLADGRRSGIYRGPIWIGEETLKRFAGALVLDARRRILVGYGRTYCMFTRANAKSTSTAPTVNLNENYKATAYSRTMYAKVSGARIRSKPSLNAATVRTLAYEAPFAVRQKTTIGQSVNGSTLWYGNSTGLLWMHSSVLKLTT